MKKFLIGIIILLVLLAIAWLPLNPAPSSNKQENNGSSFNIFDHESHH